MGVFIAIIRIDTGECEWNMAVAAIPVNLMYVS